MEVDFADCGRVHHFKVGGLQPCVFALCAFMFLGSVSPHVFHIISCLAMLLSMTAFMNLCFCDPVTLRSLLVFMRLKCMNAFKVYECV